MSTRIHLIEWLKGSNEIMDEILIVDEILVELLATTEI